ncbi:MAG TPA: hypothetical protein VNZ86_13680 [Bacteroidia bacterium]|nr:hypothetical protein [Bacteroidia bacterium]
MKYRQTLIEPGIIKIEVTENAILDLEDVLAMRKTNLGLNKGKNFCILWDSREVHFTIDPEALHRMASAEYQETRYAAAILVNSLAGKLVGNFFKSLTSGKSPTRLFQHESEALEWLRKFL